jgi:hypothetical protein
MGSFKNSLRILIFKRNKGVVLISPKHVFIAPYIHMILLLGVRQTYVSIEGAMVPWSDQVFRQVMQFKQGW